MPAIMCNSAFFIVWSNIKFPLLIMYYEWRADVKFGSVSFFICLQLFYHDTIVCNNINGFKRLHWCSCKKNSVQLLLIKQSVVWIFFVCFSINLSLYLSCPNIYRFIYFLLFNNNLSVKKTLQISLK